MKEGDMEMTEMPSTLGMETLIEAKVMIGAERNIEGMKETEKEIEIGAENGKGTGTGTGTEIERGTEIEIQIGVDSMLFAARMTIGRDLVLDGEMIVRTSVHV